MSTGQIPFLLRYLENDPERKDSATMTTDINIADTHPPPAPPLRAQHVLEQQLRNTQDFNLWDARVKLAAAALQGMLAGPVPEGASQHPIDLGLVAVQHADATLWALLEKPCTRPEDDDAMLAALVPHLETGMTDPQVRAAMTTLDNGGGHV